MSLERTDIMNDRTHDTFVELVPWARETALHPGFIKRINGPLGAVCMRCYRYRHHTLGEAWEPSQLDSLRHPLLCELADSGSSLIASMLRSVADLMLPGEDLREALRRLQMHDQVVTSLNEHIRAIRINLYSRTREGIIEHASFLMSSREGIKCQCRWRNKEEGRWHNVWGDRYGVWGDRYREMIEAEEEEVEIDLGGGGGLFDDFAIDY